MENAKVPEEEIPVVVHDSTWRKNEEERKEVKVKPITSGGAGARGDSPQTNGFCK